MAAVAITPDQDVVTAEICIAAPPERVFQTITDPSQALKWWGQQGMYRVTEWNGDVRPGGKWSSAGVGARNRKLNSAYLNFIKARLGRRALIWFTLCAKKPRT